MKCFGKAPLRRSTSNPEYSTQSVKYCLFVWKLQAISVLASSCRSQERSRVCWETQVDHELKHLLRTKGRMCTTKHNNTTALAGKSITKRDSTVSALRVVGGCTPEEARASLEPRHKETRRIVMQGLIPLLVLLPQKRKLRA